MINMAGYSLKLRQSGFQSHYFHRNTGAVKQLLLSQFQDAPYCSRRYILYLLLFLQLFCNNLKHKHNPNNTTMQPLQTALPHNLQMPHQSHHYSKNLPKFCKVEEIACLHLFLLNISSIPSHSSGLSLGSFWCITLMGCRIDLNQGLCR